MKVLKQIDLINSLNIDHSVAILLGAGCSLNSGCKSSNQLVEVFKKRIYCVNHSLDYGSVDFFCDAEFKKRVDEEFSDECPQNEYSYFFEKCFRNRHDRNIFIKNTFLKKKPSFGYLCFANYIIRNKIKYILTTNFDRLTNKAINMMDINYDFVFSTDSINPIVNNDTNIIELHGDYNFDLLKNTEKEVEEISTKLTNEINKIDVNKFIVIGYSGLDTSVMNMLHAYLKKHSNTSIYWCIVDSVDTVNKNIRDIVELNSSSALVRIKGFDELFEQYYRTYGPHDEKLDCQFQERENGSYIFKNIKMHPQKVISNAFLCENDPLIYEIDCNKFSYEQLKEKNEGADFFLVGYREKIYGIGSKTILTETLSVHEKDLRLTLLSKTDLKQNIKCLLVKNIILLWCKNKGNGVYFNNIYSKRDCSRIKESLKINVDIINGKMYLILKPDFIVVGKISEKEKKDINKFKSNLYANKNYSMLQKLRKIFFKGELVFDYFDSKISFSMQPLSNNGGNNLSERDIEYSWIAEPKMITSNMESVNQIKLLYKYGPREILYSKKHISVGVFCVEEKKQMLKSFLNKVEYGNNTRGVEVVPSFKGFEKTFGRSIEFNYECLPKKVYKKNLTRVSFNDFINFVIRGIKAIYENWEVDIVLLFFGEEFEQYRNYDDFDFHDLLKLKCANKYKTQLLTENSIKSRDNINKKLFNLSVGIFTKTIGMPWYPALYSSDTLFIGMSFGVNKNGVVVGCSQMFDGAGRGLKLIVSSVSDKKKKNQYLTKDEARKLGEEIRTTYYKCSKPSDLDKIVIHRTSPFRKEEIEGFKQAFEGIEDIELLQIIENTNINFYSGNGVYISGYPLQRGSVFKIDRNEILLWTDGIIKNEDICEGKISYRNSKRGMGKPIIIRKFLGKDSIEKTAFDILNLTKMDFNSADVIYSKEPVTIKYSKIVCKVLKQGNFDSNKIDFVYIM